MRFIELDGLAKRVIDRYVGFNLWLIGRNS